MKTSRDPKPTSAEQSRRFIEAARELGCDESEEDFAEIVRKMATTPAPTPDTGKKVKPVLKKGEQT